MASKNNFKQLTVADKLTVIANLESTTLTSKRSLARQFDVDEATIRRIWQSRDMIKQRSENLSEEAKAKRCRLLPPKFNELEDELFVWIEKIRKFQVPISPSLVILKAKDIANKMGISTNDFRGSWGCLW